MPSGTMLRYPLLMIFLHRSTYSCSTVAAQAEYTNPNIYLRGLGATTATTAMTTTATTTMTAATTTTATTTTATTTTTTTTTS